MQSYENSTWKQDLLPLMPTHIQLLLQHIEDDAPLEEVRIRANQPLHLVFGGYDRLLYAPGKKAAVTAADCEQILARMTEYSLYAWEDKLKNGFITMRGGYRVGLCGNAVYDGHSLMRMTEFTSLVIRIARQCIGCADMVLERLIDSNGYIYPTLILSPPGCGKTTLLRDLARAISCGNALFTGKRICIVDERMELAGCVRGVPQFDVGVRTDVLSGMGKQEGILLSVRTLSPEVIITDELGSAADASAVQDAAFCGVSTIASAHVHNIDALRKRLPLMELLYSGAMQRVILLGRIDGRVGQILGIYTGSLREVLHEGGEVLCFERS